MYGVRIWIGEVDSNAVPYYNKETMIAERFGAGWLDAEERLCRTSITHIQPNRTRNSALLKSSRVRTALSKIIGTASGGLQGGLDQASALLSSIEPLKNINIYIQKENSFSYFFCSFIYIII